MDINRIHSEEDCEELIDLIMSGDAIAYAGSGLSNVNGTYPSWYTLVEEICQRCGVEFPTNDIDADELIDLAEEAKNNHNDEYCNVLFEKFGILSGIRFEVYDTILKLPFQAYVTTNYDPQLHLAKVNNSEESRTYERLMCNSSEIRNKSVFYLHGYAKSTAEEFNCESLILSRNDFADAYDNDQTLNSFLYQLFKFNSVVFLGCRLKEEPLQKVLMQCKDSYEELKRRGDDDFPPKYILLPTSFKEGSYEIDKEDEVEENKYYEDLGIKVVRYDAKPSHYELTRFLKGLMKSESGVISSFAELNEAREGGAE